MLETQTPTLGEVVPNLKSILSNASPFEKLSLICRLHRVSSELLSLGKITEVFIFKPHDGIPSIVACIRKSVEDLYQIHLAAKAEPAEQKHQLQILREHVSECLAKSALTDREKKDIRGILKSGRQPDVTAIAIRPN